jgi:hypothetical protein
MRISSAAVLVGIIVSSTIPAMAFYPSGTIDKNLSYDSIEIDGFWVSGKLYNRSSKPIRVDGAVRFVTIHKQVINYAQINVTVPPKGFTSILGRLVNNNHKQTKNAYDLQWNILDYSRATNRFIPRPNVPKYKYSRSSGYANTRASEAFINVFGKGNHKSDQFALKYGRYVVKVSHIGEHHCRIDLIHRDEGIITNITNGGSYILESKTIKIDWGGYFYLDVFADGDWTVRMEYQEPEAAQDSEFPDQNSAGKIQNIGGTPNPVVIKMKNERTIHADYYWEEGDKIKVAINDAIITIAKKDIKEIVAPAP